VTLVSLHVTTVNVSQKPGNVNSCVSILGNKTCDPSKFACDNGKCIPEAWKCQASGIHLPLSHANLLESHVLLPKIETQEFTFLGFWDTFTVVTCKLTRVTCLAT
jgi:hypothetical protein